MKRSYIDEIKPNSKQVLVKGWVERIKIFGQLAFIILRDRTDKIQCVATKKNIPFLNDLKKITKESSVEIKGTVKKNKEAKKGYEIIVNDIKVLSKAASTLPIDVEKSHTQVDKRLDYRFLDTRRPEISTIFKIRSNIYKHLINFFSNEGFMIINTPKITTIGLESGAESFEVKYFDKKASLAQSPQFYKQMFVMGGFEKVMEIGQVYRAEKSHTTRHLTEFTGIDFEMGFIKDENDVMDVIEKMIKYVLTNVKKEMSKELELLNVKIKVPKKIPRIPMPELKKILAKKGKILRPSDDLDVEAEKIIGGYSLKKFGEEFIFVTNYPWAIRPFYHMKPDNDPNGTKSFDLLWKGMEIATGAQREHRIEILKQQAKEKEVVLDSNYADIFKFGAIPHGGVGFGLDRITQMMLNLENIREALLLTRDPERIKP